MVSKTVKSSLFERAMDNFIDFQYKVKWDDPATVKRALQTFLPLMPDSVEFILCTYSQVAIRFIREDLKK